ncbi:RNA polymerase sigma factor [Puniceicoccaceae bacterium K14]|nr:RNA polymerase sigma factor [Puniceicoccaceae bacterium K14]
MKSQAEQNKVFKEWINSYKGLLFKITKSYARTLHDQDDLFQEISLKLWKSIPKFKGNSSASTWIYRVSLNAANTWALKESKRTTRSETLNEATHILAQGSEKPNPRVEWLYEQINKLDPIDRSLTLMMFDGFSYADIAAILGISESNVGVKLYRIKKQITKLSENLSQ